MIQQSQIFTGHSKKFVSDTDYNQVMYKNRSTNDRNYFEISALLSCEIHK